jgi:Sel1 repeat
LISGALAGFRPPRYATALRLFRPLADKGDDVAQFDLGVLYNKGWGVPRDYVQTAKWYRLAAAQGNVDARYNLGILYDDRHRYAEANRRLTRHCQSCSAPFGGERGGSRRSPPSNIGVEIGQVAIVSIVVPALILLDRLFAADQTKPVHRRAGLRALGADHGARRVLAGDAGFRSLAVGAKLFGRPQTPAGILYRRIVLQPLDDRVELVGIGAGPQ